MTRRDLLTGALSLLSLPLFKGKKQERKFLTLLTSHGVCQVEVTHLDIKPGDTLYAVGLGDRSWTEMEIRASSGTLFEAASK